jgi:hypothetical protein
MRGGMRDKKRIKRIVKLLEKLWLEYPDQRLGQLLSNYCFVNGMDIFYQEDDQSEEALRSVQ